MPGLHLKKLMEDDPVVVTGMGLICSAGATVQELWKSVCESKKTVEKVLFEHRSKELEFPVCRVKMAPYEHEFDSKFSKFDRSIQFGIYAAYQSLKDSGIQQIRDSNNIGVIAGSSRGPIDQLNKFLSFENLHRVLPSYSSNTSVAALSGAIARALGLQGVSMTISANCSSSAIAIAISAQQILLGLADAVICGGAEAPLNKHILASMDNAGILAKGMANTFSLCKPFDVERCGTVLGEGSGFLVLERMSNALKRHAKVYAVLAGFAYEITPGSPMGIDTTGKSLADLITRCMNIAGVKPEHISFTSLHGTGTRANDIAEAKAVERIFKDSNPDIPVFSIKPITGHCLGASPALESIVCIKAMNEEFVPPVANCDILDPDFRINLVRKEPLKIENPRYALVVTSGFWGYKAVLIFKKYEAASLQNSH